MFSELQERSSAPPKKWGQMSNFPQIAPTLKNYNNRTTKLATFFGPEIFQIFWALARWGFGSGSSRVPKNDFALKTRLKPRFTSWSSPSRPRFCLKNSIENVFQHLEPPFQSAILPWKHDWNPVLSLWAPTPDHNFTLKIRWKTRFSSWRISSRR